MEPERTQRAPLGLVRNERMLHALLTVLVAFLLIGWARPKNISGMSPGSFWAGKLGWHGCADLVLGGDSRTYVSVAPSVLRKNLPGRTVLNFGFDNAGFSREYLAALEAVLKPAAGRKTIILGITPHSLTPDTRGRFQYRKTRRHARVPFLSSGRPAGSPWFDNLTEPIPLEDAVFLLAAPARVPRHQREYHADGWLASRLSPEEPENGFAVARRWYRNNRVDPSMVADLLDQVGAWAHQGIRVYAFRPPTTAAMIRFEDPLSGFDQESFIRQFEAAGGHWLDLDQTRYHTYDSSHLDRDAARAFTKDLARLLPPGESE
jgi:hypothetical protein